MANGKKAIHFGGGNIGRGFVGEFLNQAGYEVVFVDVVDSLIESLQKQKSYVVTEVSDKGSVTTTVSNYRAINSKHEEAKVVDEIATADVVTCAVGANVLRFISPVIAKGLNARKADKPVAVIACENMINATDKLRDLILAGLSDETKAKINDVARFANSAVDRIVPQQEPNAGLDVKIEHFWEWCVELPPFKGVEEPKVEAIKYVDDLQPYIERKLFTVNTGHASTAYFAHLVGKGYIHEAMADKSIVDKVRAVLKETSGLIVTKHHIPQAEQDEYVSKIIARFSNPDLKDSVARVGRQPLRKLGRNERLISPAAQIAEAGGKYDNLLESIEAALRFQNIKDDAESEELAKILKENDADAATQKLTGLEVGHPLYASVLERVKKVQG